MAFLSRALLLKNTSVSAPRVLIGICAVTVAFSAVAYELLLATYATFLLGASIFQYSLVFSLMMASMGVGALIAQSVRSAAVAWILAIELSLTLCACLSIPLLYSLFAAGGPAQLALLVLVVAMGVGLGMEVPLLNSIQKDDRLAEILMLDYLGGFAGGLLFPLWLLPSLGFFRLAGILACLNAVVGVAFLFFFKNKFGRWQWWLFATITAFCVGSALTFCFYAESLRHAMEWRYFKIQS